MSNQLLVVNVLTDFLRKLTENVNTNNEQSILLCTSCAVPQRIIFGPIVFILIYDEFQISEVTGRLIKYADEITPIIHGRFNETYKAEAALVELTNW